MLRGSALLTLPTQTGPKGLREVTLLGLVLANNPRAAEDSLSLPSGQDTQAEGPRRPSLSFASVTPIRP